MDAKPRELGFVDDGHRRNPHKALYLWRRGLQRVIYESPIHRGLGHDRVDLLVTYALHPSDGGFSDGPDAGVQHGARRNPRNRIGPPLR